MKRFTAFLMLGVSQQTLNQAMPRMTVTEFTGAMRLAYRRLGLKEMPA